MSDESNIIQTDAPLGETRREARTDEQLVALWLHGLSRHTVRAYQKDSSDFFRIARKAIHAVTLSDIQQFAVRLSAQNLAEGSRHRKLSAIKSIFAFAYRIGYLPFDTAKPLRLPSVRDTLNERILAESEVQRMIALERRPRDRAMLTLLYASGVRVSELVGLKWRDAQERCGGGQITVYGKRGKTRTVLLPTGTWLLMLSIRSGAGDDAPMFVSRKGRHLDVSSALRIVKRSARRAGIERPISPHWFRHAHASHALDRGAPIHLVQTTLGHASVATTGRYLHARPTESSGGYLAL